jgi:dolichyl-diphosphooligosaccharide---protein glycosyltransferase
MRRIACAVLLAVLMPLASANAQDTKATSATAKPTAVITMENGGQIALEFWPDVAPNHVKNFTELAAKGFYDGQRVHRMEPRFVVQFGDPQSKTLPMDDPKMGTGGSGKTIKAEFNSRPFERGVLGMARTSDPDSASSQVYLMLGNASHLNGQYTAFGKVTKGMDVVDKIKVGDRIKSIKVH